MTLQVKFWDRVFLSLTLAFASLARADWLVSLKDLPCSPVLSLEPLLPRAGIISRGCNTSYCMSAGGLNSCLHVCTASVLPTEPWECYFEWPPQGLCCWSGMKRSTKQKCEHHAGAFNDTKNFGFYSDQWRIIRGCENWCDRVILRLLKEIWIDWVKEIPMVTMSKIKGAVLTR